MNKNDFEVAVGEAAQDAVWSTPHQLTYQVAEHDPRRERYLRDLREYQLSVGRQVLAAIENLRAVSSSSEAQEKPLASTLKADFVAPW
jgi:hypothetical protein